MPTISGEQDHWRGMQDAPHTPFRYAPAREIIYHRIANNNPKVSWINLKIKIILSVQLQYISYSEVFRTQISFEDPVKNGASGKPVEEMNRV